MRKKTKKEILKNFGLLIYNLLLVMLLYACNMFTINILLFYVIFKQNIWLHFKVFYFFSTQTRYLWFNYYILITFFFYIYNAIILQIKTYLSVRSIATTYYAVNVVRVARLIIICGNLMLILYYLIWDLLIHM